MVISQHSRQGFCHCRITYHQYRVKPNAVDPFPSTVNSVQKFGIIEMDLIWHKSDDGT